MAIHAVRHHHMPARRRRTLESVPRAEPRPDFDRDYWIAHSEGYRVECGEGRLGFVEATRPDPARAGCTLLVIRCGVLGRYQLIAHSEDVAMIVPRAERIWLGSDAQLAPVVAA